jgi:hypothetical protein
MMSLTARAPKRRYPLQVPLLLPTGTGGYQYRVLQVPVWLYLALLCSLRRRNSVVWAAEIVVMS